MKEYLSDQKILLKSGDIEEAEMLDIPIEEMRAIIKETNYYFNNPNRTTKQRDFLIRELNILAYNY